MVPWAAAPSLRCACLMELAFVAAAVVAAFYAAREARQGRKWPAFAFGAVLLLGGIARLMGLL